jgi:hypothetical protein
MKSFIYIIKILISYLKDDKLSRHFGKEGKKIIQKMIQNLRYKMTAVETASGAKDPSLNRDRILGTFVT